MLKTYQKINLLNMRENDKQQISIYVSRELYSTYVLFCKTINVSPNKVIEDMIKDFVENNKEDIGITLLKKLNINL